MLKDWIAMFPENVRTTIIICLLPFLGSMGYFNHEFKKLQKRNPEICIFRNESNSLFCIDTLSKATRDITYEQAQAKGFYARDPLKDPRATKE